MKAITTATIIITESAVALICLSAVTITVTRAGIITAMVSQIKITVVMTGDKVVLASPARVMAATKGEVISTSPVTAPQLWACRTVPEDSKYDLRIIRIDKI